MNKLVAMAVMSVLATNVAATTWMPKDKITTSSGPVWQDETIYIPECRADDAYGSRRPCGGGW